MMSHDEAYDITVYKNVVLFSEVTISGDLNSAFFGTPEKHCFNASFKDNDQVNSAVEVIFSLEYVDFGSSLKIPVIQPNNITITVKDDDG